MLHPRVSIVIPTLNEAPSIGPVLRSLRAFVPDSEVIVVDSSEDGTDSVAASEGAKVIRQPRVGYGAALRRGVEEATCEYVVFMDGDGTYDPSDIERMAAPLESGLADIVSGCRFGSRPKSMSTTRYVGNLCLNFLFRLLFGLRIKDSQTGMKAARRDLLSSMELEEKGMPFSTEVLAKGARLKLRVQEIRVKYHDRIGKSKLNPLKDGLRIVTYMLKERAVQRRSREIFTPSGILIPRRSLNRRSFASK